MREQERIEITDSLHEAATTVMWGCDDFIVTGFWAASVWGHGMILPLIAF